MRRLLLGIAAGALAMQSLAGLAETPEEIRARLERGRERDRQEALRKQETLDWLERKKKREEVQRLKLIEQEEARIAEEYAKNWKIYGNAFEVNIKGWWRQRDGNWITHAYFDPPIKKAVDLNSAKANPSIYRSQTIWVKVRMSISLEDLASSLGMSETILAKLNEVDEDHRFASGDWLVLPSSYNKIAKQLAAIDTSELRQAPPLTRNQSELALVRFGDTLFTIAQRHNMSISELLQLNPHIRAARLVVGTQIRIAPPGRRRMLLGLKPIGSEGLSWPDSPDFGLPELNATKSSADQHSSDSLIGVSCSSLHVNKKKAWEPWGKWERPTPGSPEEELLIDRCSKKSNGS